MDLDQRVNDLFDDMKTNKKGASGKKDAGDFELKQIEFKLNKHLQEKQKLTFKRVSVFNYSDETAYNENNFNTVLEKDVEQYAASKRWQSMPMCLKWKYVQGYLKDNEIVDIDKYKDQLKKGTLQVDFDTKSRSIVSLTLI